MPEGALGVGDAVLLRGWQGGIYVDCVLRWGRVVHTAQPCLAMLDPLDKGGAHASSKGLTNPVRLFPLPKARLAKGSSGHLFWMFFHPFRVPPFLFLLAWIVPLSSNTFMPTSEFPCATIVSGHVFLELAPCEGSLRQVSGDQTNWANRCLPACS